MTACDLFDKDNPAAGTGPNSVADIGALGDTPEMMLPALPAHGCSSRKFRIREKILEIIQKSAEKTRPVWLENYAAIVSGYKRREIRDAVKELVEEGELVYTYVFGNSCLEKSFKRPVRVSESFVLKPSMTTYEAKPSDIVVSMEHGASFGAGDHPTTRLALRGIEMLKLETSIMENRERSKMLDIGTGSGVLAIASLKMGIERAVGTDIDACARNEARINARLNGLEERFEIFEGDLAKLHSSEEDRFFDLITANLRFPTLAALAKQIEGLCRLNGAAVFSGVRPDEFVELSRLYRQMGFVLLWESAEKGWAGGAFLKGAKKDVRFFARGKRSCTNR